MGLLKVIAVYLTIFGQPSAVGKGVEIAVYNDSGVVIARGETNSISEHSFTLEYGAYAVSVEDDKYLPCGEIVEIDSEKKSIVLRCYKRHSVWFPIVRKKQRE